MKANAVKVAVAAATIKCLAKLPLPLLHSIGVVFGWGLWLTPNEQRRIAAINIGLCWPQSSAAERRRLLRQSLVESAKSVVEMGHLWTCSEVKFRRYMHSDDSEQRWQDAARESGAVIITPHLGGWEAAGLYVSCINDITSMYRPNRIGGQVDRLMRSGRERFGATLVPTDSSGVRLLMRALRGGGVVGILPDQSPGADSGLYAPFFDQPAYTMVLVSKLAQRCQVPVFIVFAERLSWGRGYRLRFQQLPTAISGDSLSQSVAVLNQAVEQAVREVPAQYLWSYKRFKRQPLDQPKLYRRRSSELLNKRT